MSAKNAKTSWLEERENAVMCCGFLGSYMLKGHVPMCPKGFKFPGPKPVRLQGFMISDASFVSRDHISRGVKQ